MRRRLVIMLAVLLAAGCVTNAAVAWYVLRKVRTGEYRYPTTYAYFREPLEDDSGDIVLWELHSTKGRGLLYVSSYYGPPHDYTLLTQPEPQDVILAEMPRWAEQHLLVRDSAGTPIPHTDIRERRIYAGGFPMLSFYAVIDGDIMDKNDFVVHGGITIELNSERYGDTDYFVVPYRPIIVGLIINTVVWALPWSVLLAIVLGSRRLWRYERGRCPRCAYDLRRQFADGCPECGWRRAETS